MYDLAQRAIFLFIAFHTVSANRWWRDTGYDGDLFGDSPEPTATLPPKAPYQHYLNAGTSPLNATIGMGIYPLLATRQLGCRSCDQPGAICCNNGTYCCPSGVCQDNADWCCPAGFAACSEIRNSCAETGQICCGTGVCPSGSVCCGRTGTCCDTSNSTCTDAGQCLALAPPAGEASISSVSLQSLQSVASVASLASQSQSSSGEGSSTVASSNSSSYSSSSTVDSSSSSSSSSSSTVDSSSSSSSPTSSSSSSSSSSSTVDSFSGSSSTSLSETSSASVVVNPPSSSSSTETTVVVDPPQTSSVSISDSSQTVVPFEETASLDASSSSFVDIPSGPVADPPSPTIDPDDTPPDPNPPPADPQPTDDTPPNDTPPPDSNPPPTDPQPSDDTPPNDTPPPDPNSPPADPQPTDDTPPNDTPPPDPNPLPADPQPTDDTPPNDTPPPDPNPPAQDADTPSSSSTIVVETSVSSGVTLTVSHTVVPQILTGTAPANTATNTGNDVAQDDDSGDAVALVYPWDPRIQYDPASSWVSTTSDSSVGTCHNGTKVASQAGASIKFAFDGKSISVLTCQGSKSGDYSVQVDGAQATTVDGYKAPGPSGDQCIISQTFNSASLPEGSHSISIIVKGASSSPLSGGTSVEFGGFIYRGPNAYGTDTGSQTNVPAIVGGTVGGVIGGILILTIIVVIIIRRRRRNQREDDAPAVHTIPVVTSGTPYSAVPTTEYHDPYASSGYGPNYYPNPTATPSTQPAPAWRQTNQGPFGDGSYVAGRI